MNKSLTEPLAANLEPYQYMLKETSYLGLKPGDLIQINYEGWFRYGLVVSSRGAANGMFVSSRYKALLNVVDVQSLSEGMFPLMVNNLYKNRSACNYHSPAIIGTFLGKNNFRTFNTSKMTDLISIEITKDIDE